MNVNLVFISELFRSQKMRFPHGVTVDLAFMAITSGLLIEPGGSF
jgi:hypothetical protein